MALTSKKKAFCDDYIITLNATESYLKFYKNVKNRETARANASRLLNSPDVKSYLEDRMKELDAKAIAKQEEILKYLTSVMRGEHTEEVLYYIGEGTQGKTRIEVAAKDKIKAAELLGKRYGIWTDKVDISEPIQINIVRKSKDGD